MPDRHLIVAAHPDDEQIGCAGVIMRAIAAGEVVRVLILTSGQELFRVCAGIDSEPSPSEVGALREEESLRSCRLLGLEDRQVIFLRFQDGTLAANRPALITACQEQITDFHATRIYCTSIWDAHPDHRAAAQAVAAAKAAANSTALYWQYARRERIEAAGAECISIALDDLLPRKRQAMCESRSHLGIISPHQQEAIMADFLAVYCRPEECFSPFID